MTQPQDPTTHGLGITPTAAETPRDVFDFIQQEWMKKEVAAIATGAKVAEEKVAAIQNYVDIARELFGNNQAIGLDHMSATLALRFQDGNVLPFCDVPTGMAGVGSAPAAYPIAAPQVKNGNAGEGGTAPSPSWGITDGN